MGERKYDQQLHIRTVGIREWGRKEKQYNRYEATPYKALDKFFDVYTLNKNDRVVDFGCGRGRVTFYIHDRFHVPVTGVEANDKTFEEALMNKQSYRRKREHIEAPILLEFALAEQYPIYEEDNCFYFFNPFSHKIFKQVVRNILKSVEEHPREVDIILYYPLEEFTFFLNRETPFDMLNQVVTPGDHGKYGRFVLYRYNPGKQEIDEQN